jgi:uncharacterized protein DUF6498
VTVDTLGRAFDLYRRTAASRSAIVLLLANAIPLVGVLFFGWSLITILVLFWIENGIVGFWNVPRILLARQSIAESLPGMVRYAGFDKAQSAEAAALLESRMREAQAQITVETSRGVRTINPSALLLGRLGGIAHAVLAVFFVIHYGLFWLVHGIFVFALPTFFGGSTAECTGGITTLAPGFPPVSGIEGLQGCGTPYGEVVWSNVAIAAVALFLSHGASFFLNYIGRREYLTTSPIRQMTAPYGRVVVLHLTIIFGAMAVAVLGAPIAALVVLVVLKTAFDLRLHLGEHRERGAAAAAIATKSLPI